MFLSHLLGKPLYRKAAKQRRRKEEQSLFQLQFLAASLLRVQEVFFS
jgi:hypothetical protein